MNLQIYGKNVRGASHIRNNTDCQDNFKTETLDHCALIAVADGHGSASCPFSKSGSQIAVNVFCHVMKDVLANFQENPDMLPTWLNREGEIKVAQAIDSEWKRRVRKAHRDNKREKPFDDNGKIDLSAIYPQYGTTLLGLMICPGFIFAFQLGDGDIIMVDDKQVQPVIDTEKILGTETHSLCKMDSWKKAVTMVRIREADQNMPYMYFMSTDGFSNSYKSTEDMKSACRDYFSMIREHGFQTVAANLSDWLSETSEMGCGDDITVVLSYFEGQEVHNEPA